MKLILNISKLTRIKSPLYQYQSNLFTNLFNTSFTNNSRVHNSLVSKRFLTLSSTSIKTSNINYLDNLPVLTLPPALINNDSLWISESNAMTSYILKEIDFQGLVYEEQSASIFSPSTDIGIKRNENIKNNNQLFEKYYKKIDIYDRVVQKYGSIEGLNYEKARLQRKGMAGDNTAVLHSLLGSAKLRDKRVAMHYIQDDFKQSVLDLIKENSKLINDPNSSFLQGVINRSIYSFKLIQLVGLFGYNVLMSVKDGIKFFFMFLFARSSNQSSDTNNPVLINNKNNFNAAISNKALEVGILGNLSILIMKGANYFYTGSFTMLIETIHSLMDIMGQAFLRHLSSKIKGPDSMNPYGNTMIINYFAAFAATGVFAAGFVVNRMQSLTIMHTTANLETSFLLLIFCAIVEASTLRYAWIEVKTESAQVGVSPFAYLFDAVADPRTVFIVAEDTSALLCCIIGAACTMASHLTGSALYDIIGTWSIISLLFLQLLFVARRAFRASGHPSMDANLQDNIQKFILSQPIVSSVHDIKTTVLGPMSYRFKADINLDRRYVAKAFMEMKSQTSDRFEKNIPKEDVQNFWVSNGSELISYAGDQLYQLEKKVKKTYPAVHYVDFRVL